MGMRYGGRRLANTWWLSGRDEVQFALLMARTFFCPPHGKKGSGIGNPYVAAFDGVQDLISVILNIVRMVTMGSKFSASRREFFRAGGRYILLAALTAAGAMTLRQHAGAKCANSGICAGCGVFTSCGLPQALSARHALSPDVQAKRQNKDLR